VRVSAISIEIGGGTVKFIEECVLHTDARVQPRPEGWPTVTEWKVRYFRDPAGAVRASGEGAVQRRIRSAAHGEPPRRETPRVIINIGERSVQRSQGVVGIVGEPSAWLTPVAWFS
jgi:hypothetical protein